MITDSRVHELWEMGIGQNLDIEIAKLLGWTIEDGWIIREPPQMNYNIYPPNYRGDSKNFVVEGSIETNLEAAWSEAWHRELIPYFTTDLNAAIKLPLAEEWHNRQIREDANRIPFPLWQVDIVDARIDSDTQKTNCLLSGEFFSDGISNGVVTLFDGAIG